MNHAKKFIQKAIRHPGSLHRFAAKHHALNRNGTINLPRATKAAKRLPPARRAHRLAQIRLATNLRHLQRRK